MKHGVKAISLAAVVLASWLTSCASPTDEHVDVQNSRVLQQPLSVVQPCVPRALERLGITVDSQNEGQGKLTINATSPSGVDVTVDLEAMTSGKTYVAVRAASYSLFGNWLASDVADAIAAEVATATASAPAGRSIGVP